MATTSVAAFLCLGTLGLVVLLEVDAICSLALLSTKGEERRVLAARHLLLQQCQSKTSFFVKS